MKCHSLALLLLLLLLVAGLVAARSITERRGDGDDGEGEGSSVSGDAASSSEEAEGEREEKEKRVQEADNQSHEWWNNHIFADKQMKKELENIPYSYADRQQYERHFLGMYPSSVVEGSFPEDQKEADVRTKTDSEITNGKIDQSWRGADRQTRALERQRSPGRWPRLLPPGCPSFPYCLFMPVPPAMNPAPSNPPYRKEATPNYMKGEAGNTDWIDKEKGVLISPSPRRAEGPAYPLHERMPKRLFGYPKMPPSVKADVAGGTSIENPPPKEPSSLKARPPKKPDMQSDIPANDDFVAANKELYDLWRYEKAHRTGHDQHKERGMEKSEYVDPPPGGPMVQAGGLEM